MAAIATASNDNRKDKSAARQIDLCASALFKRRESGIPAAKRYTAASH